MTFKWESYKKFIEENFTIVDKGIEGVLGPMEVPFILNKAQLHFIKHLSEKNVILKARKMGFSSVLLAIACTKLLMGENEKCISMSFNREASMKQLERARHFIRSWERKNGIKAPFKYDNTKELVWEGKNAKGEIFVNSLRIGTAKSSAFGRGDDITFLHLTEVSEADSIAKLLAGAGEAVVHNAMTTLETTANGFNEFKTFWDEASAGQRGYTALFYDSSWEYDKEYVDRKRANLGHLGIQEYPMTAQEAFLTSGETYFDSEALIGLLKLTRKPMFQNRYWRKYRDWEKDEFVVCFADTAWGGVDSCAAQFLSNKLDVPLIFHSPVLASEMTPYLHGEMERIFDKTRVRPVISYERNNGGIAELERLYTLNRNGKYIIYQQSRGIGTTNEVEISPKLGWDTTRHSRETMLMDLKSVIDTQTLTLYDEPTMTELFSFIIKQTNGRWKPQAEDGAHDDLVMSLAGVWQMHLSEKPLVMPVRRRTPPRRARFHL